jgi:hypothetical protein
MATTTTKAATTAMGTATITAVVKTEVGVVVKAEVVGAAATNISQLLGAFTAARCVHDES